MASTSDANAAPEQDSERIEALARLRQLRRPLPPDFHFDREDANARSREEWEPTGMEQLPARSD